MTSPAPVTLPGMERGDVRPGMRLGRYEILLGIAQGGMARVWAARQHGQRGFSKIVVIKTILPSLASDREFEAMFLDEARIAALVHHPNVCEIFDLGEEQGVLYLAMEFINGDSLARVIKPPSSPMGNSSGDAVELDPRVSARIIADAAAGLHAAHELCDDEGNRMNVVHRDVSPQNLLVSIEGNVKVTDFGVVKALGSMHEATMAGQIKGKAAYMSPEQAAGGKIDRRSDVFALGICLYEATTGRRPFPGPGQIVTLKQLIAGQFRRPSEVIPSYPRELESVLMRAMSRDPMQRFPTADRMRVALEEWLAKSGPVVTETQVGLAVRQRLGQVVDERRARIRRAMSAGNDVGAISTGGFAASEEGTGSRQPSSGMVSAPSSGGVMTPAVRSESLPSPGYAVQSSNASSISNVALVGTHTHTPPPHITTTGYFGVPVPPRRPRSAATMAVVGVLGGVGAFVVIAGAIGLVTVLNRRPAPPQAVVPPPPPSTMATPAPATAAIIRLRPTIPSEGLVFELDGAPLNGLTIPRPQPGRVRLLTAKAAGYLEETFRLDDQSPEVLEVLLAASTPAPSAVASFAAAPIAPGPVATVPGPLPKPVGDQPKPTAKPVPKPKPDIPDNPFE